MADDKNIRNKWIQISYIDDNLKNIDGYFILVEQKDNYVKILSGKNILTIPYHKINKMKEKKDG